MSQLSLFDDISRPGKEVAVAIAKKSKAKQKTAPAIVKGSGLLDKINFIRKFVEEHLGKYKDNYICIQDIDILRKYVDTCLADGRIALDTETTGLNVFRDKIVGISLDSKSNKSAYIPINHVSYNSIENTFSRIESQLTIEEVLPELKRLAEIKECDMFNAPFDRRVIIHNFGIDFPCTWDSSIGARIMDENLPQGDYRLKPLHAKYVLDGKEDEFSFGEIFNDVGFDKVPIDIATIYAAHDADITTEYGDFQRKYIYYEPDCTFEDRNGMNGASWCFFNIEMPCIDATVEMEENGITLDLDYQKKLSEKYNAMKADVLDRFYAELAPYEDKIAEFRHSGVKLDNPININSTKQLAVLIYDILQLPIVDKKKPRGTGEEIIAKFNNPITNLLLEYRGIEKLIGTYIDKMPDCIEADGKVHCSFNQYGARTGRYSSSNPNMQNIPSHNKDIRPMFSASDGYLLMSLDYSQQEPKCLAGLLRKDGDSQLYDTFMSGKQLYADIASIAFHKSYEECLEFHADGTEYPEGAERRSRAKKILLASLYGMGVPGIANDLNISIDEAQKIKDAVYKGVPAIPKFEKASLDFVRENGYVATLSGRKRRLPDMLLDEYEFRWVDPSKHTDILGFDDDSVAEVPDELCDKYWYRLQNTEPRYKRKIFEDANKKDGVWIVDNTLKIDDATRQVVNSRIQGTAADLTKLAMIEIHNDKVLKELGFRLLLQVHDELIGEAPEEVADECAKRVAKLMSVAAERLLQMPISCDAKLTKVWYQKED